jgi:hypothetical protein
MAGTANGVPMGRRCALAAGRLTTGQVARACGCSPRTIALLNDEGDLPGYRAPGSKDRRFLAADVLAYMRSRRMPVPGWLAGLAAPSVLVVGGGVPVPADAGGVRWLAAPTAFRAGQEAQACRPAAAVIAVAAVGPAAARDVLAGLAAAGVPCVVLLSEDSSDPAPWLAAGAAHAVPWPGDPAAVAALARRLAGEDSH